jgi:hypothetical protein
VLFGVDLGRVEDFCRAVPSAYKERKNESRRIGAFNGLYAQDYIDCEGVDHYSMKT